MIIYIIIIINICNIYIKAVIIAQIYNIILTQIKLLLNIKIINHVYNYIIVSANVLTFYIKFQYLRIVVRLAKIKIWCCQRADIKITRRVMQLLESARQRALIKLNTYNRRIHIFVKICEKVSLKKKFSFQRWISCLK